MLITKLCTIYVGIGIFLTRIGVAKVKRKNPELYNKATFKDKLYAYTISTLSWPKPVFKGFYIRAKQDIKGGSHER